MICYRDMTFCSRSKDCANTHCFRYIDEEVERGAKVIGLPLAEGDCSSFCKDGFTPTKGEICKKHNVECCPNCHPN